MSRELHCWQCGREISEEQSAETHGICWWCNDWLEVNGC